MTPAMAATEPAVVVEDVWRAFGRQRVLRGVDLSVATGRALAILGPNGSGKSTLLRVLAALLRPVRGRVRILGEDLFARPAGRAAIGFVGHEPMLYRGLSVRENLLLFGALYGLADPPAAAGAAITRFALEPWARVPVRRLSRGLAQRSALARALLHAPRVLLLDEALSGLDLDARSHLAAVLDGFRAAGGTLVLATHDPAEALRLADDGRVLAGGRLTAPRPLGGLDAAGAAAWYRDAVARAG